MGDNINVGLAEQASKTYSILQTSFEKNDLDLLRASYTHDTKHLLEKYFSSWYFRESHDSVMLAKPELLSDQSIESLTREREYCAPIFASTAYSFYKKIVEEPSEIRALIRLGAYPHQMILRELFSGYQISPHIIDKYVAMTKSEPAEVRNILHECRQTVQAHLVKQHDNNMSPSRKKGFHNNDSYASLLFSINAKLKALP